MSKAVKDIVVKLEQADESFEFYPTTNEIIQDLYKDLIKTKSHFSLLDIGAGNGKVLDKLKEINAIKLEQLKDSDNAVRYKYERFSFSSYAIEKSQILIDSLHKDIIVVGTDFFQQSLLDKQVGVIFSNPPYSKFSEWTAKIIKEATSEEIYLVIPKRWSTDKLITQALELREVEAEILGEYSFENSEDRAARAYVNLIKIKLKKKYYNDPFSIWFDEHFKINADKDTLSDYKKKNKTKEKLKTLVSDKNFIFNIVEFFNKDMTKLLSNYKAIETLDFDMLKELGVDIKTLKEGLRLKISGLKNVYWSELFGKLDTITNRLTTRSRKDMLDKMTKNTNIDFTESNIYAVVIWVIKNSNDYFDKQLLEVYSSLTTRESIQLYKSNHRIVEDGWRFNSRDVSHYSLDYRIIKSHYNAIDHSYNGRRNLNNNTRNLIQDIFTVAVNLGFSNVDLIKQEEDWYAGKKQNFYYTKDSKQVHFAEIKAFRNGNLHFKFCLEFMKKLNIEASRLNGWIKSPKQATEEFDITIEEAESMFNSNLLLNSGSNILLLK